MKTRPNGIEDSVDSRDGMYLLYKIVIYLYIFIFNCNYFLFSAFCFLYRAK